jgi:hypothetical protein
VLEVRRALQAVVRGEEPAEVLASALRGVTYMPAIADGLVSWTLSVSPSRELAVRAVLAWDALARYSPGRLRPCANDECRLFLIDRSKANAARWCSMAVCGNRMKARRHYQRARKAPALLGCGIEHAAENQREHAVGLTGVLSHVGRQAHGVRQPYYIGPLHVGADGAGLLRPRQ